MQSPARSDDLAERASAPLFDVYDEYLVPLLFQAYADDVARRLTDVRAGSILEIAAGTGAATRAIAATVPDSVAITATDLVQGMVDRAEAVGTPRPVCWEQADVMALPYEAESFDVAVCQFGAMFFDPKADAFAEVCRVLRPGGRFLCSMWSALDDNDFAAVVHGALREAFRDDPPQFLERVPFSYHDAATIEADLRAGGFDGEWSIERVEFPSRAASAFDAALALCAGTPVRNELEARGPDGLPRAIAAASAVLADRFGETDLEGRTAAALATITRRGGDR